MVNIYVGTDRSQLFAVKVLEHSIARNTDLEVNVIPMHELEYGKPKDLRQQQRTGFSFTRFCIPKLNNYQGKAIYVDADMLVLKDIKELWNLDFGENHILVQEELPDQHSKPTGDLDPTLKRVNKRVKQSSVMLLDCSKLDWNIEQIIKDLDEWKYSYDDLMFKLCLVDENKVGYKVPFRWNSLEHLAPETCLIHYTDMYTQPWVYSGNPHEEVWLDEVRLMLSKGVITINEVQKEVELGYFRPSIVDDILRRREDDPSKKSEIIIRNREKDLKLGYVSHKEYAELHEKRKEVFDEYNFSDRF